jgi:hypothetical protein
VEVLTKALRIPLKDISMIRADSWSGGHRDFHDWLLENVTTWRASMTNIHSSSTLRLFG